MGILLYTHIEGGGGTSEGMSVFVGILLYTCIEGGCLWDVIEKSCTMCLRVYFYIPMIVEVFSVCVGGMCRSYVCRYTFVYP